MKIKPKCSECNKVVQVIPFVTRIAPVEVGMGFQVFELKAHVCVNKRCPKYKVMMVIN